MSSPSARTKMNQLFILASLVSIVSLCGCHRSPDPVLQEKSVTTTQEESVLKFEFDPGVQATTNQVKAESPFEQQPIRLTNVAGKVGLDFTYLNGAEGQQLMVESLGGGCGWIDFDLDGWPDLFLPQGGKPDAVAPLERPADMLFRNFQGKRFESVEGLVIGGTEYSQGAAIGDFDGDGFDDIYVTNVGSNALYHNQGDGTFLNVTESAGVGDERWSSSAAWTDLNQDGLLDLYVCNYADYDPYSPRVCAKDGQPALCHPREISPVADECYLNNGDFSFQASATRLGLYGKGNRGLGVVTADFNADGRTDVYVCNDTTANFLFLNQPDGTFHESAFLSGTAFNSQGYAQASMGVAVGDYDRNQALDLYLTHFTNEENALYQNLGKKGLFREVAGLVGLRPISYSKLGFGTVMQDFNCDGLMDLFVANGHIDPRNADGDGYKQNPQVMTFAGTQWVEVSKTSGDYFQQKLVGRGVALADYDRDGDFDLAVVHQNSPLALLRNDSELAGSVSIRFLGSKSSRHGINTRVWLTAGDETLVQELSGGSSYCVTHYPELVFPTFEEESCSIRILWPSGIEQKYENMPVNSTIIFREDGEYLLESPSL